MTPLVYRPQIGPISHLEPWSDAVPRIELDALGTQTQAQAVGGSVYNLVKQQRR